MVSSEWNFSHHLPFRRTPSSLTNLTHENTAKFLLARHVANPGPRIVLSSQSQTPQQKKS